MIVCCLRGVEYFRYDLCSSFFSDCVNTSSMVMDSADLFRHILTTKTLPEEPISDYVFRFKTVFYNDVASYCCCRCAYDHEYFSYISESGEIDWEKCDTLVQAIKDGMCQHAARATKKGYLSETRVNVFHISVALESESLLQVLFSKVEEGMEWKSGDIKSGLFSMPPYGVAALRGNEKVFQMIKDATFQKSSYLTWLFSHTYKHDHRQVLYAVEKEHNIFQITNSSILEICNVKGHIAIMKMFLDGETFHDLYFDRDNLRNLFKYNLADIVLDPWLSNISLSPASVCPCGCRTYDYECIYCEGKDTSLMTVWEIAELAVIHNVRNIFNKSIQLLNKACSLCSGSKYNYYRRSFFELCRAFQRHDFEELLSTNECQNLCTESISETRLFVSLFGVLNKYTLSRNDIESAMKQIPYIQRIVNAPFGVNTARYMYPGLTPLQSSIRNLSADKTDPYRYLYPGLTPLQSYMRNVHFYDVSVVRTFIDVGADIDQMFQPSVGLPGWYEDPDTVLRTSVTRQVQRKTTK